MMKTSYTREELYELVWTTPIVKLAEQFRLSDRGFAKICHRHQIPVPGRGYWAKVEAGQIATRTPLWKLDNPNIQTVHVGGKREYVNPHVASAIEATKAARSKIAVEDAQSVADPSTPEDVLSRLEQMRQHPSLRTFTKELLEAEADRTGAISVRWVQIHRDSGSRVIKFLSALAFGLERHGITFDGSGSRVKFARLGSAVDFQIRSPKKRVQTTSPHGWKLWENIFIGRLEFQIFGNAEGIKKNWVDTDSKKIEDFVASMVESYRVNLVVQAERDEKQLEIDKRRQHSARRRELSKLRAQREENRLSFFNEIAAARSEAAELRRSVSLIEQGAALTDEYRRMLDWANERLKALEARTSLANLQGELLARNLFPDPDDLEDPEGDPPPMKSPWDY